MGIIDQILRAGLTPLIFIGSSSTVNRKNPFSYVERASLIHSVYDGDVVTLAVPDHNLDFDWKMYIENTLFDIGVDKNDCILYFYHKEGEPDVNKILEFNKWTHPASAANICSSDIRADPVANKEHMHVKVYDKVIETLT